MSFWSKSTPTKSENEAANSAPRPAAPTTNRTSPPSRPTRPTASGAGRIPRTDSGNTSRHDLFEGSGYDADNRRHFSNGGTARSTSSHRYQRHPDEENGYFNSKEDEEHAYQETVSQIKKVKGQSVDTSRSTLRRLRETEEIAASSMRKLQEQSDKLTSVEARMTDADYYAHRAENKTQDLQKLNKNFIVSSFSVSNPFTKSKRREQKLQREVDERRRADDEKVNLKNDSKKQNRQLDSSLDNARSMGASNGRSRTDYMDEEDENCEMEREIDSNLNEMSATLSRLKMMGQTMNEQIVHTNKQIQRVDKRTDTVNDRVRRTEAKLERMN